MASLGVVGGAGGALVAGPRRAPAIWLTTQTEAQRRALETAPWLEGQVAILLTRAEIPYEVMKRLRVLVDSEEGHDRLLRDDA